MSEKKDKTEEPAAEEKEIIEHSEEKLEKIKEKILAEGKIIEEEIRKGFVETKLSKISALLIGRKVKFRALVVGEVAGKAVESKLEVVCEKCSESLAVINLIEEKNYKLFYLKIRKEEIDPFSLSITPSNCRVSKDKQHKPVLKPVENEYIDYSVLFVRELPEQIEALNEEEYSSLASKTWKVYYLGIPLNAKKIEVVSYVVKNTKTNEIEFVSSEIKPLEEEFLGIKITADDEKQFEKYFRDNPDFDSVIENQLAPHIVGRGFAKLSALLTLHSPYEIYDIFGTRKIRGCLRTVWPGDPRQGKSEIGKDITRILKIGEFILGETSSRSGLVYSIDSENKVIIWGILPLNDRKFVFIDGFHGVTTEEIMQMREVLEQQMVKVSRLVSGERLARVRIIVALNPEHPPMRNYYYKIQALMDTRAFRNPVDLTRWDIVVPFSMEDVEGNLIVEAKPKERPIPVDIFRKHVFWAWSLNPEQIKYSDEAKELIVQYSRELYQYVCSDYPLIHSGVRDQLSRISAAFACLRHSVVLDEKSNFACVEVKPEHVKMAKEFIEEMIRMTDYDAFILRKKGQTELNEEEYFEINEDLDETDVSILRQLVDGSKSSSVIGSVLGVSDRSVREHFKKLRKHNLIETSQGFGARLTPKGIQFLKMHEKREQGIEGQDEMVNKEKHFYRLDEPYFGVCSYCGTRKYLEYGDEEGNHLCRECYLSRGETNEQ